FDDWFYSDGLHPNNDGHLLMADCIMRLMDKIDKEEVKADNIADVNAIAPVKTSTYQGYRMIDSTTKAEDDAAIVSVSAGGFSEKDKEVPWFGYEYKDGKDAPWFADNWMHTASGGDDPLKLTVNCSSMLIVYKISNQPVFGQVDLFVDGGKTEALSCYDASGWNNGKVCIALDEKEAAEHTVELRMAGGSEDKQFTVMAIGYK
ncbi:MAG: SGNH/GDSL hydrolase family protein, partial [Agathobacter sp.]|nr:SGNH/GDSL hydrolase family protein [Agathobacter sp.]